MRELTIVGVQKPIQLKKQARSKQLSIKILGSKVVVAVPKFVPYVVAEQFVHAQKKWIIEQLEFAEKQTWLPVDANYKKDKKQAKKLVEHKLTYWNKFYDFHWGRVAIRDQSTRWGSCSSKGNLNFNWKIFHLPEELQNYLIVHELCHLEHPNHSKNFWITVAETLPEYKQLRKRLKELSLVQ